MKVTDKNNIEIEVGDWLMDCNTRIGEVYIVTKITEDGIVYGEIPVEDIYNKMINLDNVRIVRKQGGYD